MCEINRRFIVVMPILSLGLAGCKNFSSLLNQSTDYFNISKIHQCVKTGAEKFFPLAAKEEKNLTCEEIPGHFPVQRPPWTRRKTPDLDNHDRVKPVFTGGIIPTRGRNFLHSPMWGGFHNRRTKERVEG